jgi:23S rRNA (cytosine1962-C5)-methyltransferase
LSQIVLKPRSAKPFVGRHPWVFDSAIQRIEGTPSDGDVVDLVSSRGEFIARGVFNGRSRIHVRLYTWELDEKLDEAFWRRRLETAWALRRRLGYDDPQGAARMVFSEGDGLSGLVVDRYGEFLVVQPTALAMAVRLEELVPMLVDLGRPQGIFLRTERDITRAEGIEVPPGLRWGRLPDGPVPVRDHGIQYAVDPAGGQKTGTYLDQRENRPAAARYFAGGRVLDVFCYTGGFALTAAAGGAREVLGIDSSRQAVAHARANAERNGLGNVRFQVGEAFATLGALSAAGERFDGLVLDPPRFAGSRGTVPQALRAYHRLNRLALGLLPPGGILVTCSCSGHVGREDFLRMLRGVAQQGCRDLQVLESRGAAPDHPVAAACPETEYLKCFVCRLA